MILFSRKKPIRSRTQPRGEISFRSHLFRGFLVLTLLTLFFIAMYYATRVTEVTLVSVDVVGGETISHDEVRQIVLDELRGSYLWLIPKRFAFMYPQEVIRTAVSKVPRTYDVVVERQSLVSLLVSFKEYSPHALWCTETIHTSHCYFLNNEGYAFAPAPNLQGGSFIRHHTEGLQDLTMGNVISKEKLLQIDTFILQVEQGLGLRITELLYDKNNDIHLMINGGGMILASANKDFASTYENLKSVLVSKEFKHIAPGNFKYIDVRFDNKVFVNEELTPLEPTSTSTGDVTTLPE